MMAMVGKVRVDEPNRPGIVCVSVEGLTLRRIGQPRPFASDSSHYRHRSLLTLSATPRPRKNASARHPGEGAGRQGVGGGGMPSKQRT